jgi:hypothetical protein
MAQVGFTPILIYASTTGGNAPAVGNLTNSTLGSELAINITDGKLFYKDNANAIQVIGWKVVPATAGGTGQTSYTTGDILYASSTTVLSKLADVATGNALISGGVGAAPSWGKIGLTTHISGTLAVGNGGTGITTTPTNGQIPIGNGTNYTAATLTAGTGISLTNGAGSISISSTGAAVSQITTYTSGSGTYTVPASTKYLQVLMVGGGGGGAGSDATGGPGGSGGNTTFGTATAGGGGGGATNGANGGPGGNATLGVISGAGVSGGVGDAGVTGGTYPKGGIGGATALGGAGSGTGGTTAAAGGDAKANTGGGGGGASCATAFTFSGSGGGAGAYINGLITSPGASYSYGVGAGGTAGAAGTNGFAGGAGGSGLIVVIAYF